MISRDEQSTTPSSESGVIVTSDRTLAGAAGRGQNCCAYIPPNILSPLTPANTPPRRTTAINNIYILFSISLIFLVISGRASSKGFNGIYIRFFLIS
ncbi:MAG: hypothetical protein UZ21_OP11001001188 [Microgenomates bacterium OLB22]|nr:MAG: hypothetical protein UZ21_OP11001001188 [Microgenomates bacterium OLB22]